MAELSVLDDREERTLTVWLSDRHQEHVCEETGDAAGRAFETAPAGTRA